MLNSMSKIKKRSNAGAICLLAGGVFTIFGAVRTIGFLRVVETYKTITARQLVLELIIPHMVLLFGLGLLTAAAILLIRATFINRRLLHKDI